MNVYFEKAIETIQNWIKIPSVKSEALDSMPFGKNVNDMLLLALKDAENLGFDVKNYDGYIGEVVFGDGEDKEGLAILCHLDVVPAGDLQKWDIAPYLGVIKDGFLYGRGVSDDKGPAVLCLYALKELKDEGFIPNRKIKLIFGCDEESGWGCIDHYNKVAVMPNEGFSPDGDFPVIYAEKGILHVEYLFDISPCVKNATCTNVINMVCDKVSACFSGEINLDINEADVLIEKNTITATGKSAHGSTPHLGDNAIKKLLKVFVSNNLFNSIDYKNLFENYNIFSNIVDETGNLTFSPNLIEIKNGKLAVKVDVRYPSTFKKEEVENALNKIGKFTEIQHKAPLMCSKSENLVKTLLNVYKEVFNDNAEPISTGGGTYARALKSGVAFGPTIGEGVAHIPNEKMSLKSLENCYLAYKKAIKELAK